MQFIKLIVVIFVITLTKITFAQRVSDPKELNNSSYYSETENKLGGSKKLSLEENKLLLEAYYYQWKYKSAIELINSLDKTQVLADPELKKIYINLKRISGDYSSLKGVNGIKETDINNFINWPIDNSKVQDVQFTNTTILDSNERYTGGFITSNNELFMAKISNKDKLSESYYRIKKTKLDANNQISPWENAFSVDLKKTIYNASPTFFKDNKYIFSMNNTDAIQLNEKKMKSKGVSNGANTLGLYIYDLSTNSIENLPEFINIESCNNTHPFFVNEKYLFFSSDREKLGNMDIYFATITNGQWSEPRKLAINSEYDDVYPVVFEENFYFSSRGHENFGGLDVFRASLEFKGNEVVLGKPKNMLLPFNSTYDDILLDFISNTEGLIATNRNTENGDQILAFKLNLSDGIISNLKNIKGKHIEGFLDIYTKDEKGEYVLENRLTTLGDGTFPEFFLEKDKDYKLVYSSPGKNDATIYVDSVKNEKSNRAEILESLKEIRLKNIIFEGLVTDRITEEPLEGILITAKSKDKDGNEKIETFTTDKNGKWAIEYDSESEYDFNLSKSGYEDYNKRVFNVEDLYDLSMLPLDKKSKKGDKISIPNIYFDFNSANLQAKSYPILDNIVTYLKERPDMRIELSAHTDAVGTDSYNLNLSNSRALTSYNYLVKAGVNPKQLVYKGYGETQLVNHCKNGVTCSEEENEVNRRVELKILSEGERVASPSAVTSTKSPKGEGYGITQDGKYYIVTKGQTIYRVFAETGVSIDKLKELNNLKNNNTYDGMRLKLE